MESDEQTPSENQLAEHKAAFEPVLKFMKEHGLPEFFGRMKKSLKPKRQEPELTIERCWEAAVPPGASTHASASSFQQTHLALLHWKFEDSSKALKELGNWEVTSGLHINADTSETINRRSTRNQPTVNDRHCRTVDLRAKLVTLSAFFESEKVNISVPRDWMPAKNATLPNPTATGDLTPMSDSTSARASASAEAGQGVNVDNSPSLESLQKLILADLTRDLYQAQLLSADQKSLEDKDPRDPDLKPYPNGSVAFFKYAGASKNDFRGPLCTMTHLISAARFNDTPLSEMIIERYIGPAVHGFFEMRRTNIKANQILDNALIFLAAASRPKPDICTIALIPRLVNMYHFVIGAAEAKAKPENFTHVQLAAAFHPTLILMVLLHLRAIEHSVAPEHSLPDWYILIGITYDMNGVIFYVHFPTYDSQEKRWYFHSMLLDDTSKNAFRADDEYEALTQRANLARKLLAMQRHMAYVRNKLTAHFSTGRSSPTDYFPDEFKTLEPRWRPEF